MKRLSFILFILILLFSFAQLSWAKKSIKIGSVYILSGAFSTYGEFAKKGINMAIDEINKKGGILGRKLTVKFEDSKAKPPVAIRAIRKLVYEEKVDFLVGLDSSGVALGVVPMIPELKRILIIKEGNIKNKNKEGIEIQKTNLSAFLKTG